MAQRIKGQDVTIQLAQLLGPPLAYFTDIRNFEMTPKIEKLEEQYLGQFSKKYDEIYHGVDFKFDIHVENPRVLDFVKAIRSRGNGQQPTLKFNITATLSFPGQGLKKVTLMDCFFEDIPFSFGGRSEYGQITISGSCEDFSVV